jgi:hypothetical protein
MYSRNAMKNFAMDDALDLITGMTCDVAAR